MARLVGEREMLTSLPAAPADPAPNMAESVTMLPIRTARLMGRERARTMDVDGVAGGTDPPRARSGSKGGATRQARKEAERREKGCSGREDFLHPGSRCRNARIDPPPQSGEGPEYHAPASAASVSLRHAFLPRRDPAGTQSGYSRRPSTSTVVWKVPSERRGSGGS